MLQRLTRPTPLQALVATITVGYFVLWGCFSTAAPTLRPVGPMPAGTSTELGAGLTGSLGLINSGVGGTAYVNHRLTPQVDLGGYFEYGAVVPTFALSSGGVAPPIPFDRVAGVGLAGRWRLELSELFTIGAELHGAYAQTFQLYPGVGRQQGPGPALAQVYVGVPMAVSVGRVSVYTNPALGGLFYFGTVPALYFDYPSQIPLPTVRVPLGVTLRVTPRFSLLAETGIAGIPLVSSGPYFTFGAATHF